MVETLKIVHFIAFVVGIGGGLANLLAGVRLTGIPPEAGPIVGKYRETLGKLSTVGLMLLWLTGIALIRTSGDENLLASQMFQLKLGAVIILTGFSIAANMTIIAAKKAGGPPNAARMKKISLGANTFGFLALILAVITFS